MEGDKEANASATGEAKDETREMLRFLTPEERERVSVLQQLLARANQPMLRQLREEGVESVVRRSRSDRGEARIDEDWQ